MIHYPNTVSIILKYDAISEVMNDTEARQLGCYLDQFFSACSYYLKEIIYFQIDGFIAAIICADDITGKQIDELIAFKTELWQLASDCRTF